jgi:hypothetical protein
MKSYGLNMQGKFFIERIATLPAWDSSDEGREVYVEDVDKRYYGTNAAWVSYSETLGSDVGIGGVVGATVPSLRRCSINTTTGVITADAGPDLMLNGADDTSPDQEFIAAKIWNSVWNDIADFQKLDDNLIYGKCYYDTKLGARICNTRCQKALMGIASNTFGYGMGVTDDNKVPIAVAGWVLAYVDQEYETGTPLTNDENGNLTEMTLEEKRNYPERLIALYKYKEENDIWGTETKEINVDNRHWIQVK